MGRIKTQIVKRYAKLLLEKFPDEFTEHSPEALEPWLQRPLKTLRPLNGSIWAYQRRCGYWKLRTLGL